MQIFIMTEQPVTCPFCGTRAEIIFEFKMDNLGSQLCRCHDKDCEILFIEQEEEVLEKRN